MDTAQKLTQPLVGLTGSFFENAMSVIDMKGYGDTALYALLATLLFFHFIFYCLENNQGMQKWGRAWWQVLHETRVYLQVGVIKHVVYWGAFWVGLYLARTQGDIYGTISVVSPWVQTLTLLFILNKVCVLLTQEKSVNPSASWPLASDDYDDVSGVLGATALLSMTRSRTAFVIVYWLQSVSDIVLQNVPSALFFGYGVGCALPRA